MQAPGREEIGQQNFHLCEEGRAHLPAGFACMLRGTQHSCAGLQEQLPQCLSPRGQTLDSVRSRGSRLLLPSGRTGLSGEPELHGDLFALLSDGSQPPEVAVVRRGSPGQGRCARRRDLPGFPQCCILLGTLSGQGWGCVGPLKDLLSLPAPTLVATLVARHRDPRGSEWPWSPRHRDSATPWRKGVAAGQPGTLREGDFRGSALP